MQYVEVKYINIVSSKLRNFKKKSDSVFNFSCPLCGDSKVKKNKARGYFIENKGTFVFHCHNCTVSLSFPN